MVSIELNVETFWVIYIVTLIVLGIIIFIISKSGRVPLSAGFLAATVISGAFILVLISYSVGDLNDLPEREKQIINILYMVMGFLVLIAVFWVIFDLVRKNNIKNVTTIECDEDVCTVKTEPVDYSDASEREKLRNTVTAVCDEDGCHNTGLTPKRGSTRMNVRLLS